MRTIHFIILIFITGSAMAQQDSSNSILAEVVVIGQHKPQSVKNSVYQVRVITIDAIRLSGATNIQQALISQLGFRFYNDNSLGTADVQLLGMNGRNVKILLDGVPMLDRGNTRESLNQVDVNTIERIEIVEGPMSVSYGSDALAGVINIITKKPINNMLSVVAKVHEETAGNEYYPLGYKGLHTQTLGINGSVNKWAYSLGSSHNEHAGYGGDTYGRGKIWRPKEPWLSHARLGYANEHINLYYRLDGLHETISNQGPINYDVNRAIDQFFITKRLMHQLQNQWRINAKADIASILSYTGYQRSTKTYRYHVATGKSELTTGQGEQDVSKFRSFVFRNTLGYTISPKLSLQTGLDINYEKATGARIKGEPAIIDYALFVSTEIKPTDNINIRPGLRFIKNTLYDAPPVVPSINTKFVLNKQLSLRLSYAYGFRSPALRELYFNFIDASHTIIGNPNLKAEYSNSFLGSLSWAKPLTNASPGITSTLSGFYNTYHHLIAYGTLASSPDTVRTINVDKYKTTGATIETKLNTKSLNASIGFSYIGGHNKLSDTEAYNDLPAFMWSPEISSNIMYTIQKIKTTVGLFYKYTGERQGYELSYNASRQEEVKLAKIAGFHWADITVSKPLFGYFTLAAGVKNIFNVNSLSNTGVVIGGVAHGSSGPIAISYGRSYFLSLAFEWNKK